MRSDNALTVLSTAPCRGQAADHGMGSLLKVWLAIQARHVLQELQPGEGLAYTGSVALSVQASIARWRKQE